MKSTRQKGNQYPANWKEIAGKIKKKYNYCCERCGHKHNPQTGHVLTVHHLDGDPSNNEKWNLACLCQKCHLIIQGRIKMNQFFWDVILPVSEWFKPHLKGYLEYEERNNKRKRKSLPRLV